MKKNQYKYDCYRHPRTRAEKRANQDCEYARASRRPPHLPSSYDDRPFCVQKSWKVKRKHQYRERGRGAKHTYEYRGEWSTYWRIEWAFGDYCEDHNIPYTIEDIYDSYTYTHTIKYKSVPWYEVPVFHRIWEWQTTEDGKHVYVATRKHQIGTQWVYHDVELETPIVKTFTHKRKIGCKLIWWSDKDIGLEYILNRTNY